MSNYHGIGRRKSSVARVWIKKGKGSINVNGKAYKDYFDTDLNKSQVTLPLKVAEQEGAFDVHVRVCGGGLAGQAGAIKLGIARALIKSQDALKPALKKHGLLTVDSRVKERKKYGQRGARRKFQFVKR